MKKSTSLFFILLLFLISCNGNNSKQTLPTKNKSDSLKAENRVTYDSVILNNSQKTKSDCDTTVYDMPATTARLEEPDKYFRTNNKFKNWDKRDKRRIPVKCIAEKDGSTSNIRILQGGSGNIKLDKEAVRLIKQAKLTPARNEKNEIIRSYFVILIHFPSE